MAKTYKIKDIEFQFSPTFRKWHFKKDGFSLISEAKGGAETAHKIAAILAGAIKRGLKNGAIDGLARANISRLND
jgi:hypothetical protein